MKFLLAILLLFAGIALDAADDPGVVKGKVFDRQTSEPLPFATVIYGRNRGTTSGHDGFYSLTAGAGDIILTIRYVGYRSVTRTVTVIPNDTVILDVGLDYDVAEIDQIVVSAGKGEQRLSELTVSVNIIKPEVLSSSHITDITGLFNKTPGIEVLDGQASIRGGSGFSYGAGSRVLALIDGLPVLSADAGNIKWHFLPVENISQIEIIKGASSVLYGSSALNGVINFRTSEAGDIPLTRFYVETGMFDNPRRKNWIWWDYPRTFQSASLSHLRRSGNTDIGFAIHMLSDGGYRKLNEEKLGRLNFRIRHNDKKIEGLSYGINLNSGITRKTDFILWENAWTGALKQDEATANQLTGNLITLDPYIILDKEDKSNHRLKARFQSSGNNFTEAVHNNSNALSFLTEYQFSYNFSERIHFNSGIMENYSRIASKLYGDHDALNLAAYAQTDITLVDGLKFVAGLRVEYNTLNGINERIVPLFRAGVNYRIFDYTFLRASFGQGYRYPSIAEKHAATTLGSVRIVPNPFIRAESGWNTEAGIKQGIITDYINGQLDLALFYTRNTDMIEYLFGIYPLEGSDSFGYGFRASNVEHSRIFGGEFEFSLTGNTGMIKNSIAGGYVFIFPVEFNPQAGLTGNTYLKYRRMHSLKVTLNSNYNKIDAGFSLNAGSRMLNIDGVFLNELTRETILPGFYEYWNENSGGHLLVDLFTGFLFNENLKISFVIKNALNGEYMGRPGDIMPHRSFSVRLSYFSLPYT